MFKIPDLSNLDVQGALDKVLEAINADEFVKTARYLPRDEPAPAGCFVLSLRDPHGEKVEIAIEPAGPLVSMIASIGLKVL